MWSIKVPYIKNVSLSTIPEKCVKIHLKSHNWSDQYSYFPDVLVNLWHDNETLFINYEVLEKEILGITEEDNGNVYKDSCTEFFLAFDDNGYYNIEANCIGTLLMSHRKGRKVDVQYAPPDILNGIERESSLGRKRRGLEVLNDIWTLTLKIPISSFFKHKISSLKGMKAKCNFYKCGDNLPSPHYISWKPILTDTPDFHRPEFFGEIIFD